MKAVGYLRRAVWSPYLAGSGLGVLTAVSLVAFDKRLSGAGGYQHLAGYWGRALSPSSVYWKYVSPTGLTWEVLLVAGTLIGALAAALAGKQFKWRVIPERAWVDRFGPSIAKRWLLVLVGTAIIEFGAGLAGGCTASLAVSGGAVLAPSAFLFMAGMFGGGMPIARWVAAKERKSRARS